MALSKRIFIFYFFFVALCGYFMVHLFSEQVYPSVRQTTEETLVDTANFLAEVVSFDLQDDKITPEYLQKRMESYQARDPRANIWGIEKNDVSLHIYITDQEGIVVFDSRNQAVGKDYSKWRDVYLTLRGQYGARSTTEALSSDPTVMSSTMYVGAPIYQNGEIIGVLTVSKPSHTTDAYIASAKAELTFFAIILLGTSLLLGAILSWWLGVSYRKLIDYASKLGKGEREVPPKFYGKDLNVLTSTLSNLRAELDGKEYIENYINTLTHELKSPLAAIRGASELLQNDLDPKTAQRFLHNIDREGARLQNLIDRVLHLSMVEKKQTLEVREPLLLSKLIDEVLSSYSVIITQKSLQVEIDIASDLRFLGDHFLMTQALSNVIHNAVDFMPANGLLFITAEVIDNAIVLQIDNEGSHIPDYALSRLYERFYSLPRPDSGEKSTGLGLNFVKEVIALHHGKMRIENRMKGVNVTIEIPLGDSSIKPH